MYTFFLLQFYFALSVLSFFLAWRMRRSWQRTVENYVGFFFLLALAGVIYPLNVELLATMGLAVFIAYGIWHARTWRVTNGNTTADQDRQQSDPDEPAQPPTKSWQDRATPRTLNPREFVERMFPPRR